ncbi:hypothetical protein DH2020_022340 [Rehmannia glutinosa]|uniref:Endoglucanase n=1 Tax=Rehmannia glutinosa TaxID=99300 RepID=A0ABR0WEE2_REHGL
MLGCYRMGNRLSNQGPSGPKCSLAKLEMAGRITRLWAEARRHDHTGAPIGLITAAEPTLSFGESNCRFLPPPLLSRTSDPVIHLLFSTMQNNYGLDPIRFLKDLRVMRIKPRNSGLDLRLFDFARNHPGVYQNSIPVAGQFYTSSGYEVDYILGSNPNRLSYMVGFGPNYPKQVHHRGASIVSIKKDPRPVGCGQGYVEWFNKNAENPNVIIGAIVAGPDQGDKFNDSRQNPGQTEPSTYNNAPFVGVLARLAS